MEIEGCDGFYPFLGIDDLISGFDLLRLIGTIEQYNKFGELIDGPLSFNSSSGFVFCKVNALHSINGGITDLAITVMHLDYDLFCLTVNCTRHWPPHWARDGWIAGTWCRRRQCSLSDIAFSTSRRIGAWALLGRRRCIFW